MAEATTMKISTATRDRLRGMRQEGQSLEDVVVAALDAYQSEQFWAAAERAAAVETVEQRASRKRIEAEIDGWMDGVV